MPCLAFRRHPLVLCTLSVQGKAAFFGGNKLLCKSLLVKDVFNPRQDLDPA